MSRSESCQSNPIFPAYVEDGHFLVEILDNIVDLGSAGRVLFYSFFFSELWIDSEMC